MVSTRVQLNRIDLPLGHKDLPGDVIRELETYTRSVFGDPETFRSTNPLETAPSFGAVFKLDDGVREGYVKYDMTNR